MDNNSKIEQAALFITIAIALICLVSIWFTITGLTANKTTGTTESKKIEVNNTLYQKVTNPEAPPETKTTDPGYGRDNPFDPYK